MSSLPEMPQKASRREMRKVLIRLRMEMHRQEIRHETQQLLQPFLCLRKFFISETSALLFGLVMCLKLDAVNSALALWTFTLKNISAICTENMATI